MYAVLYDLNVKLSIQKENIAAEFFGDQSKIFEEVKKFVGEKLAKKEIELNQSYLLRFSDLDESDWNIYLNKCGNIHFVGVD